MTEESRLDQGDVESVAVGPTADLEPGTRTIIDVDGVSIGVFNVDGEYFAIRNSCPHRQGPVCEGKVTDALTGEWTGVNERVHERFDGDPAIACPWHGWEFDMATGAHLGDDSFQIGTYDVFVDDGVLYVEL